MRQPLWIGSSVPSGVEALKTFRKLKLGVDFGHTWSCYRGGEKPCGTCPTCVERTTAFHEAGVPAK